jgi:hypothetical protein
LSSIYPYLLTMGAIVFLMLMWLLVQLAWKKTFPEVQGDEDVLAGRSGCHGCSQDGHCETQVGVRETTDCDIHTETVH